MTEDNSTLLQSPTTSLLPYPYEFHAHRVALQVYKSNNTFVNVIIHLVNGPRAS